MSLCVETGIDEAKRITQLVLRWQPAYAITQALDGAHGDVKDAPVQLRRAMR